MQTPEHHQRERPRAWFIPAIVATILFIGGVAGNLVASYVQTSLDPYQRWVWVSFGIALIVATAAAIREARRAGHLPASSGEPETDVEPVMERHSVASAQGKRSVALGRDVEGSAVVTGDENVAVVESKVAGDVFGGDKVSGDKFEGDKITHNYEAAIPAVTIIANKAQESFSLEYKACGATLTLT